MSAPTKPRGFTDAAIAELIAARGEPEWMTARRHAAWDAFQQTPMPTRQDEEWRRTDLRPLRLDATSPLVAAGRTAPPSLASRNALAAGLTLVDGVATDAWLRDDVQAKGVIVTDLRSALVSQPQLIETYFMTQAVTPQSGKFAALHGAFWDNGVLIYVPRGVTVDLPVGVVVAAAAAGRASLTHTLIVLEANSQLRYVEELTGGDAQAQAFSSRVIEVLAGDGATLDVTTMQRFGATTFDFYSTRAVLGRDVNCTLNTIELGARLSKGHIEAVLQGSGSSVKLLGLYFADHAQHYDRFTLQDHHGVSTTSDLLFKGVVTDTARSVYAGYIRVHPGAKRTRAYQQNRNIQLSRTARADSNPSLEIAENDILGCTHGATIGKVDEEQLFYLMCRGLSRLTATQMIVEGFVEPLIAAVPLEAVRQSLRDEIARRIQTTTINAGQRD